jgi:amino-acid N-acetyltransferase
MPMHIEPLTSGSEAVPLLTECGLSVADISGPSPPRFFGVRVDGALVGVVGIELYPPVALLRSLAVAPAFRVRGLGRELVAHAESFCTARGVTTLYLLTVTAEAFFLKLGYLRASRDAAPAAIRATSQFSGLCPCSAAFLSRDIA